MPTSTPLLEWAQRVIDQVTPLALEEDKSFYPLQIFRKPKPELLIIGLNPKDDYNANYKSQSENPKWEFENNRMTVDRLLKGNPFCEDIKSWPIYGGLSSLPLIREIVEKEDYCFMNYFYLATASFGEAKSMTTALATCRKLTAEFIELIQPKQILVLGTSSGFDLIEEIENKQLILGGRYKRLLMRGNYRLSNSGDKMLIPVYGIPHPSYPFGKPDEVEALNTNLTEGFEGNENFKSFAFEPLVYQFEIQKLNEALADTKLEFITEGDRHNLILTGKEDQLLIRIVEQKSDKYIAFGVTDEMHKSYGSNSYEQLKNRQAYLKVLKNNWNEKTERWLATFDFAYGCQNEKDYKDWASLFVDLAHLVAK